MSKLLIYMLLILGLSSCQTYSYMKDFSLHPNEQKLGKLIPITDEELFNTSTISGNIDSYTEYHGPDKNRLEIARQFEKYVVENLSESRGESFGYSQLRINHISINHEYFPLYVVSVFTYGLLNVVGLPAGNMTVELDLSMEIIDSEQNSLGVFTGSARKRSVIAYYYGYSKGKARERSLYESIESCLEQINEKVGQEADFIRVSLQRSGKIASP